MALRADDVDLGRDRDLVARFQNGDPQAFDDLYRRYFGRLHRYCQRHTRDSHEAEEVAQEAFVKALRSMHTLEGERRFYPWMTVIAKRITIDRHRKHSRVELTDEPDLGSVDPDVDHLFAAVDAAHIRAAMDNLGPRHREVLVLREAQGMSYAEIADHLDVPVTTVEALLHRARKALRREFAAVGGDRRGLWGLPLFGWLSTRVADVRTRLGDRWIEIGAVAAPIAVGAATAAVVLVPSPDADRSVVDASAATTPASAESTVPVEAPDDPVVVSAAGSGTGETSTGGTTDAGTAPSEPTTGAGPVDVFIGPDGTDRARDEAEKMPLGGALGPTTGGADDEVAGEDTAAFVRETAAYLIENGTDDDTDAERELIEMLLGGNP
jgi:RNA polymerase sigma-70 factor (ECF subfamily)